MDNSAEAVKERFDLVKERIYQIEQEEAKNNISDYFSEAAKLLSKLINVLELKMSGELNDLPLEELQKINKDIYYPVLRENYGSSYAEPEYAFQKLSEYGKWLSHLYAHMISIISKAYEGDLEEITLCCELFSEIHGIFERDKKPSEKALREAFYYHYSDNFRDYFEKNTYKGMVDNNGFFKKIIDSADISKPNYLYLMGEYIGPNELGMWEHFNRLSDEEINTIARTTVNGFIEGFRTMNADRTGKDRASLRYNVGMERVIRETFKELQKNGFEPLFTRGQGYMIYTQIKAGVTVTGPNPQFDFDHKEDISLIMDKAFNGSRLESIENVMEKYKDDIKRMGGPIYIEVFGEEPFDPEIKEHAVKMTDEQQKMSVEFRVNNMMISQKYLNRANLSFTIISFPVPEIGSDFEDIFSDVVKINTMDNEEYKRIQQFIIDVLDKGDYVHILGKNGNKTDIKVRLYKTEDPQKETKFENCVADVNIPVGEVFTTPVLDGTNGVLNVSRVYLEGLFYKDLTITFEDGMIKDYSCSNFDTEEENRKYIKDNILMKHDTLPLGEFAIGTNTTAYAMARKYDIFDRLTILIAEKTGPHFAVGDTCYSRSEENRMYNPDGKEIIAKENKWSLLRDTEPEKAYFNCHTDITIPYEELGEIASCTDSGERISIIKDGRFCLEGTEVLNEPLEGII